MSSNSPFGSPSELPTQLYNRFYRPLMSFFLRRVGAHAEAEDLTQQVFVRLLAPGTISRIADAEAFVFTIAINLLRDRGRKRARHPEMTLPSVEQELVDEMIEAISEERTPERVLLAKESLAEVLRALDTLGERTRDIFILSRLEHMKHRNIAELFGITVSTVEKHVIKAALLLSKKFGGPNS